MKRIARLTSAPTLVRTDAWLEELKQSFRTQSAAQAQCALDWPRMQVLDNRTFLQKAWDWAFGNELLDYFGNQSSMAKPYELLALAATSRQGIPPTQCSRTPFQLTIHPRGGRGGVGASIDNPLLTLRKRFFLWHASDEDRRRRHGKVREVGKQPDKSRHPKADRDKLRHPKADRDKAVDVGPCAGAVEVVVDIASDTTRMTFYAVQCGNPF